MLLSTIHTYQWTRQAYEKVIDEGIFHPEQRVELVDGIFFTMAPQNSLHATALQLIADVLRRIFLSGYTVRVHMPLALNSHSEL